MKNKLYMVLLNICTLLVIGSGIYFFTGSSSIITGLLLISGFLFHFAKAMCLFSLLLMVGGIILVRILKGNSYIMESILSLVSMVGIATIVVVITASGRGDLKKVGALLILTSLLHNLTGYTTGSVLANFWCGRPHVEDKTKELKRKQVKENAD